MHGFSTGPLHELRESLGLADAVEFPGWIPRERLYDLYARAWAFIYPSRFEGFGLPILEAMAAGIPMACSGVEPMASLAGDAAEWQRAHGLRTQAIIFDCNHALEQTLHPHAARESARRALQPSNPAARRLSSRL
jgi:glycosyltransferase involved in cell wall biosynthesis